jgi:GxxExxY protein
MKINEITSIIIEECIYIHKKLGPGLFESVYEKILAYRLRKRGLFVEEQKPLLVIFEEVRIDIGYRTDLLVEHQVLVDIKSLEVVPKITKRQMNTYLRLLDYRIGLLINFNVEILVDGIQRFANNYVEQ